MKTVVTAILMALVLAFLAVKAHAQSTSIGVSLPFGRVNVSTTSTSSNPSENNHRFTSNLSSSNDAIEEKELREARERDRHAREEREIRFNRQEAYRSQSEFERREAAARQSLERERQVMAMHPAPTAQVAPRAGAGISRQPGQPQSSPQRPPLAQVSHVQYAQRPTATAQVVSPVYHRR